jgi:hypothetical protein
MLHSKTCVLCDFYDLLIACCSDLCIAPANGDQGRQPYKTAQDQDDCCKPISDRAYTVCTIRIAGTKYDPRDVANEANTGENAQANVRPATVRPGTLMSVTSAKKSKTQYQ